MIVATTNDLAGYRVVRHLGLVRGVTVRSRHVFASVGAIIQSMFGGNISLFTQLAEKTRAEAYDLMVAHATELGANAVLAMRHDANDMASGITEVLAYGSAVVVERA